MAAITSLAAVVSGDVRELGAIDGRAWLFIALAGLAGAGSWLAYFAALKLGQASAVSGLDRLSVAFVVVLAAISSRVADAREGRRRRAHGGWRHSHRALAG